MRIEVRVVIAFCGAAACVLVIRTMVVGVVFVRAMIVGAVAIGTAVRTVIIRAVIVGAMVIRAVPMPMSMLVVVIIVRIVVMILIVVGVLFFRGRLVAIEVVVGLALACAVDRGLDDDLIGRNIGMAGREVGCDLIVVVLQGLILRRRIVRRLDDCVFVVHAVAVQINAEGHPKGIAGDRGEVIAGRGGATARVVGIAGIAAVTAVTAVVVMTTVVAMVGVMAAGVVVVIVVAMIAVFVAMVQQLIKEAVTCVGKAASAMAKIVGNMTKQLAFDVREIAEKIAVRSRCGRATWRRRFKGAGEFETAKKD